MMQAAGQILLDILQWPVVAVKELQDGNWKPFVIAGYVAYQLTGNPIQSGLIWQDYVIMYGIIGTTVVGVSFLIDGSA
jgi:hypothetical protein